MGNFSSNSSLWVRSLRQLFKNGKPTSNVIALTVEIGEQRYPLGLIQHTANNRLLFWPALPPGKDIFCDDKSVNAIDHVTLEFPSERIHVTAYDACNKPIHFRRSWKACLFPNEGLKLWFTMLVRTSIFKEQSMEMSRQVQMPPTDKNRRIREFENYVRSLRIANIYMPPIDSQRGKYIYFVIYFSPNTSEIDQIPNHIYPTDSKMTDQVEGWSKKDTFFIVPTRLQMDHQNIYVASSCPTGELRMDVSLGFPRINICEEKK